MDKVIKVLKSIVAHVVLFSGLVVIGFVIAILLVAAMDKLSMSVADTLRLCSYIVMVACVSYVVSDRLLTWLED